MNWFAALTTGFGLGLASFGALALTVRHLAGRPRWRALLGAGALLRLALVGLVLYGLGRGGADHLLAGAAGLWLARWCVLRPPGEVRRGR